MKTRFTSVLVIFSLFTFRGFSQAQATDVSKEMRKAEMQKQVDELMNSKTFIFRGTTAMSGGFRTMNITTNTNFIKFQPEMIESEMPFFGTNNNPVGYGTETGLKFKGKPDDFTVTKNKKNYFVNAVVSSTEDKYRITVSISFNGSATLTINSNRRSPISYTGEIFRNPVSKTENAK